MPGFGLRANVPGRQVVARKSTNRYAQEEPVASHHPLLQLQREHGNRFVQRVIGLAKRDANEIVRFQSFGRQSHVHMERPNSTIIQRRVQPNFVSCGRYPPTHAIFGVIGTADPASVIVAADAQAIQMLDTVIGELEYTQEQIRGGASAAAPTINDTLAVALQDRFGIDPENREVWTSDRHRTASGSGTITLLLTRLRSVRRILEGGWIRYTCIGGECETGDWAYTYEGEYRIYLCRPFWSASNTQDQALTLLHEAFHIYFGATDSGRHMWNAHCIEQFVADFSGVTIPADFAGSCS